MKAHISAVSVVLFFANSLACAQSVPPARNPLTTDVVVRIDGMDAVSVKRNLPYSNKDSSLMFDLYSPGSLVSGRRLPALIFISGGSDSKDWKWFSDYGRLAAASGLIGINYNKRYARGFEGLKTGFSDTLDLIRHVRDHAADLNIDKDRMCLWTFSAGGRLMSAGMQREQPYIRCLLTFYGVIDLTAEMEPLPAQEREVSLETYSPLHRLKALGKDSPPILIARAGRDGASINSGIERFVSEAQRQNAEFDFLNYPEGEHGFDGFNDTESSRAIIRQAFAFIKDKTRP